MSRIAKVVKIRMAYNRKNFYKKIIEVQNLVLELKRQNEDLFYKEIYWQFIYPKYHISYRTFNSYMSINAKRELKKLQEAEKVSNQTKLF